MSNLTVSLFKDSFDPFVALLDEHEIEYKTRAIPLGTFMASAETIEIIQGVVGNAAMWGALATVVVAYIKARPARKVIITTRENTIIHAEGLTKKELESVLAQAKNLTAIDPTNSQSEDKSVT